MSLKCISFLDRYPFKRERCIVLFLLLIFYGAPTVIIGQDHPQFLQYQQTDGLQNNYILSLYQDHAGFMWIGTENGLNRFDGHHFISFRFDPDDSTSINNNWIYSIHEDQERNLWVGTQRGLNRLNRTTGQFERIEVRETNGLPANFEVSEIFEDDQGILWIIANENFLLKIQPDEERGRYVLEREATFDDLSEDTSPIMGIIQDQSGDFWFRMADGLARWLRDAKRLERYRFPTDTGTTESGMAADRMMLDHLGNIILLGNENGIYVLSPAEETPSIKPLPQYQQLESIGINLADQQLFHMAITDQNYLWIAYKKKVLKMDLRAQTIRRENVQELSFPFDVHVLLEDAQSALWVGTAGGGIHIQKQTKSPFSFFQHDPEATSSLSPGVVRTFAEDDDGALWVGLLGSGIDQLKTDSVQGLYKRRNIQYTPGSSSLLSGNLIIEILKGSQNRLWIATNASGLNEVDLKTGEWKNYRHIPGQANAISQDRIWGLTEDQQGFLWIGTFQEGLNRLDLNTNIVERFVHDPAAPSSLLDNQIKSLYTDRKGDVWIGSHAGLSRFNRQTGDFKHYLHDPAKPSSISNGIVWCIYEDHQGALWIGTGLGLNRFHRDSETFEHFFEKDGLPSNTIYGLLQDQQQNLWVSTDDGLALLLSTDTQNVFRAIKQKDGLAATSFIPKAYFRSRHTELLYFGTTKGIVIVDPLLLSKEQVTPMLGLHSFSRNNLGSKEGDVITDYFIGQKSKDITLTHLDQSVNFTFTDFQWEKNKSFSYAYQLVGLNKRWMPLGEEMEATFTNLDPGQYTLKLQAIDRYGQTQLEKSVLNLRVYPPWWRSGWAYSLYFVTLILLLVMLYRLQLRRQLEKQEAASLRRLDNFKNRLYANITHEFRTPLTIIGGMTEQIRKEPDRWLEKGTRMISDNNANLLNLVDQMLELQKVESGNLTLNYQLGDIIPFLRSIHEQFEGFAQSGKQTLTFQTEIANLVMDYDAEKITRIVSNLVSNAIKYTSEGGEIKLLISKMQAPDSLHLTVTDTGIGIPQGQLPYVFDRFFQASNNKNATRLGTGIGLSLTNELVKLMGGKIQVNSVEGQGSTFSLFLPITQTAASQEPTYQAQLQTVIIGKQGPSEPHHQPSNSALPIALIVEDNPNIAVYISICLEKHYQLRMATDGQQGIDMALEEIPDIIVSDVMMPKKNGFELCHFLKEDERTSHIPIIMLTAKVDVDSRIVGLRQGADDYLAKPFHEEELLVRMQNLLSIRQKLQARYQNIYTQPLPKAIEETAPAHREDAFILKLKESFEVNMDNPDFDATALSKKLYLSRSQLGRKVKALTGRSLSIYLRSLRLQKAQQLLHSTELSIKEIAYEVGFPTPNYFSTSYTEEFGETPTDTRK